MCQSCAKNQEPIITTAQKTVGVPQIQSEEQCRRVNSCNAAYAVRVLMRVRRAWRPQPGDDCSQTALTDSLAQRVQMTEVRQIQFINES